MQLRQIASIAGKPGLFKILKPAQSGVIIESLDSEKARSVAGATSRVSILSEISMFTTDEEGSRALGDILMAVHQAENGQPLALTAKSDGADLEDFMDRVLPDWDRSRVYTSDIKKLVSWYNLMVRNAPDLFTEKDTEPTPDQSAPEPDEAPEPGTPAL